MSEKMIFCLGEGKYESNGAGYQKNLQIFNQSVTEEVYKKTKSALDIKNFKLPIAKWIKKEDMSDDEKDNYSSYKETGGYLKTLSYQDAWKEYWGRASEEDKKWFQSLPNFDSKIFESITGINVESPSLVGQEVSVTVGGKTYKAKIVE